MPTGIDTTFISNPVGSKVIGFAEVHAHMAMGSDMSDPAAATAALSAGGVMYGHAADRFGVPAALDNCILMHGPEGLLSAPRTSSSTPRPAAPRHQGLAQLHRLAQERPQLHQQMYYKWVERAREVRPAHHDHPRHHHRGAVQHRQAHRRQQDRRMRRHGRRHAAGRIPLRHRGSTSTPSKAAPARAGSIVGESCRGKTGHLPKASSPSSPAWSPTCSTAASPSLPTGDEILGCTRQDIDREADEAWDLGVRQIFLYHDVDKALGGTGIFSSILNYVGFTNTLGFWKTYLRYRRRRPHLFLRSRRGHGNRCAHRVHRSDHQRHRHRRRAADLRPRPPVQRAHRHRTCAVAIDKIMKKGFVFDIDHAEIKTSSTCSTKAPRPRPPTR